MERWFSWEIAWVCLGNFKETIGKIRGIIGEFPCKKGHSQFLLWR